mmetsp:Transcript_42602/g.131571  ORF Transcript_42602/g.131571 Transcript_42602/m.131571 type:complete len:235 (+) Transcript_42602:1056-1760(+)
MHRLRAGGPQHRRHLRRAVVHLRRHRRRVGRHRGLRQPHGVAEAPVAVRLRRGARVHQGVPPDLVQVGHQRPPAAQRARRRHAAVLPLPVPIRAHGRRDAHGDAVRHARLRLVPVGAAAARHARRQQQLRRHGPDPRVRPRVRRRRLQHQRPRHARHAHGRGRRHEVRPRHGGRPRHPHGRSRHRADGPHRHGLLRRRHGERVQGGAPRGAHALGRDVRAACRCPRHHACQRWR